MARIRLSSPLYTDFCRKSLVHRLTNLRNGPLECLNPDGLAKYSIGSPEDGLMCHQQHVALPLQLHHHWLKPEQQF